MSSSNLMAWSQVGILCCYKQAQRLQADLVGFPSDIEGVSKHLDVEAMPPAG